MVTPEGSAVAAGAALLALVLVVNGVLRARNGGAEMYLAPTVFPVAYIATASLGPTLWIYSRSDLLGIGPSDLPSNTLLAMGLAVTAFCFGTMMPWPARHVDPAPLNGRLLAGVSRLAFFFPLGLAAHRYITGYVGTRGQGQDVRDASDAVGVAAVLLAPALVLLIAVARRQQRWPFGFADLTIIAIFLVLQALNGDRASSIAIVLTVSIALVLRRESDGRLRPLILGLAAIGSLAYVTSTLRTQEVAPSASGLGFIETTLQDFVSIPYTTGVVLQNVELSGAAGGTTVIAALIRQLPSPLATRLIGPVDDTGTFVFREMVGIGSSQGWGFSIPAEGALNFGMWGLIVASWLYGTLLRWLYSRASLKAGRAMSLCYFVAFATLPFAWRSDALGAIKGILYPAIFMAIVLAFARQNRARLGGSCSHGLEARRDEG